MNTNVLPWPSGKALKPSPDRTFIVVNETARDGTPVVTVQRRSDRAEIAFKGEDAIAFRRAIYSQDMLTFDDAIATLFGHHFGQEARS